jgi:alpha-aminoadipate/glutamate carrier protein LysW
MINCPKCDAVLDVEEEDLDEGEPLICEDCGVHLVVVGLDPLELEVEDADSTFDDDEDDDEEFEDEFNEEEDEEEEEDDDDEDEDEWR